MIKIKPRNSALKKKRIPAALQKTKIKNNTEWTGFLHVQTK